MTDDYEVPTEERDKLYPYVPVSLVPVAVVTFIILATLFFDVRDPQTYSTNPVIFYALPMLYLITFMTIETPKTILRTLGLYFPTLLSKVVALFSLPIGYLVGKALAGFAVNPSSILVISTYPWVALSTQSAGVQTLASLSTTINVVLYSVVAIFEEGSAIYMGKNIANWLDSKRMNAIIASGLGLFLGRVVLTAHHWFSYGGLAEPTLYISALFFFVVFTFMGIIAGMAARGYLVGEDISNFNVFPVLLPIMVAAHFGFDFVMSQLMIIG